MKRPETFEEMLPITGADEIPRLSCSEALRNTGRKLKLFTPALLITHGGFDRDPVIEFDVRVPNEDKDQRPFAVDLTRGDEKFFFGLGVTQLPGSRQPVNWDKRLYAIDERRAELCFAFIGGIAFSDPKVGLFANVMSYDLNIEDPTSRIGERLDVKIFGVMANKFTAFLQDNPFGAPIARSVGVTGNALPINLPRTNFFGQRPDDDPLTMRE